MTPGHQDQWYPTRSRAYDGNNWRFCHSKSARKHRRQGHEVRFSHWTRNGRCVYQWCRKQSRTGARIYPWSDGLFLRITNPKVIARIQTI